jgi:hypothetical protein
VFKAHTNEVRILLMGVAPAFRFRKRVVGDDNIPFENVFRIGSWMAVLHQDVSCSKSEASSQETKSVTRETRRVIKTAMRCEVLRYITSHKVRR